MHHSKSPVKENGHRPVKDAENGHLPSPAVDSHRTVSVLKPDTAVNGELPKVVAKPAPSKKPESVKKIEESKQVRKVQEVKPVKKAEMKKIKKKESSSDL